MRIIKLVFLVLILGIGLYLGATFFGGNSEKTEITSTNILTMLHGEGFLVTQTYMFDQTVQIDQSTGNMWKDIFWSQYTEAKANIKVSMGVDLSELSDTDVEISENNIRIQIPAPTVYSVEIVDGMEVSNKQGVLKRVFDHDDGYAAAFSELKEQAVTAASDANMTEQTLKASKEQVADLVSVLTNKDVTVVVK